MAAGRAATSVLRSLASPGGAAAVATAAGKAVRLADAVPKAVVDDIFACALKKQTGVSLKYMLDFGARPIERQVRVERGCVGRRWGERAPSTQPEKTKPRPGVASPLRNRPSSTHSLLLQLLLSAQFLHNELPVRLAHRVAELENLPYGLSAKAHVLKVRGEEERVGKKDENPSSTHTHTLTPFSLFPPLHRSATGTSNPSPSCVPSPPSKTPPTNKSSPRCCARSMPATPTSSPSWPWAWPS